MRIKTTSLQKNPKTENATTRMDGEGEADRLPVDFDFDSYIGHGYHLLVGCWINLHVHDTIIKGLIKWRNNKKICV